MTLPTTEIPPAPPEDVAARRMAELIHAMGIRTIISVDDSYALGADAGDSGEVTEELVTSPDLLRLAIEILRQSGPELGFEEIDTGSESAVNDFLAENWRELSDEVRKELLTAARTRRSDSDSNLEDAETAADLSAPQRLRDIIGSSATFVRVSLRKWRQNWMELIAEAGAVLVLIDRSFANEEGGKETTGEELLEDLLKQDFPDVWAGLLTFTAANEQDEIEITKQLRAQFQAQAEKVVAIGKFRLSNIQEFPAAIRMLLLVAEIRAYRKLAGDAIDGAYDKVRRHFDELHDYTLVGAIAAAQEEGTFELDHPLRMGQRVYQQELLRAMRNVSFGNDVLPRFRAGTVGTFVNASAAGAQIKEVLRADIFEPDNFVNELGLPIEIGDVFRVESLYPESSRRNRPSPGYYILLAQACDLSVRGNGRRSSELLDVVLQRLEVVDVEDLRTNANKSARMHVLGDLEGVGDRKWAVNFARGIVVPTSAVDATVFQVDGVSLMRPDALESRHMAAGWLKRQKELNKLAKSVLTEYRKAETAMNKVSGKEELLLRLGASLAGATMQASRGVTAIVKTEEDVVQYGIQRFGRVRSDVAVNIASLSASYSSRPAFELKAVAEPAGY